MAPLPYINLKDYEVQAEKVMTPEAWAYFHGAAGDGITVKSNTEAWQNISLRPRVLKNLRGGNIQCSIFGKRYPSPILIAPMAYQKLAHPEGELAMAAAAAAQGAGMTLSTQTSTPLQDVAKVFKKEPSRGPLWFQLYLQHDKNFNFKLIKEAEAAGYEAIVLTVDAPINGTRDGERRAQFSLPPDVNAVHLKGVKPQPAPGNSIFDVMSVYCTDWKEVDWLVANTKLPVLLKGITHPDDARLAKKHKVSGLIVSNHGGRVLDTVAPTAELLPPIADAVNGKLPIIVDGGIRRGTDVLKAIALGANAVLVGRPLVYALSCNGAFGAAHALKLLKDELEIAMILCGCKTLQDISDEILS